MSAALTLAGAAVLTSSPARASTLAGLTSAGGGWGTAKEVPGTAALNVGGSAKVASVSCASAGNCTAAGTYFGRGIEGFVVSQLHGVWGRAEKVPGLAALGGGSGAEINSVSCASAGNCSVGGYYYILTYPGATQAFVVSQVNGVWGKAEEVPGSGRLNAAGGSAGVSSVSCASARNCSAVGFYTGPSGEQAFVVSQVNGTWGIAEKVPGMAALNKGKTNSLSSVSCGSAGNCSAGGSYFGPSREQAFVVSQVHGTWGKAKEVPGSAVLNKGVAAVVNSVSCASAGNCSAGGSYTTDSSGHVQAFVVSQVNGTWGRAEKVGTPVPNQLDSGLGSVSCASAGNCTAGGYYYGSSGGQPFVVSQVHGTWGKAEKIRGIPTPTTGNTGITTLSCASAGNCSAGGTYTAGSYSNQQVFVVSQVNGTWGKAEKVPGGLNKGNFADVTSVSCGSAGNCSAGGSYTDSSGHVQAFVVSRT
jgi:hypothetical protein